MQSKITSYNYLIYSALARAKTTRHLRKITKHLRKIMCLVVFRLRWAFFLTVGKAFWKCHKRLLVSTD